MAIDMDKLNQKKLMMGRSISYVQSLLDLSIAGKCPVARRVPIRPTFLSRKLLLPGTKCFSLSKGGAGQGVVLPCHAQHSKDFIDDPGVPGFLIRSILL